MKDKINRRDFIRIASEGAAVAGTAALAGACAPKKTAGELLRKDEGSSLGKMELRTNTGNGDKVSLLGYGCMRFPMIKGPEGKDVPDQEVINRLIDYALANGVNYYDTAPVYMQGLSEEATGEALSRHPRNEYFIATKLSNFSNYSREASMKLYNDSFRYLRTDYIDYYLLHSLGRGGLLNFNARFIDNGMMEFLQGEREKGKVRQLGLSFHGNRDEFDQLLALHDKYHWDFLQIQMNYWDWQHADGERNVNADYLYEQLDKREIPIVVMEPLLGGRLASPAASVANRLKERDPQASMASWAFRFTGSYPRILTILSGMVYLEHLQDNLNTFQDFKPLTPEELEYLSKDIADIMANYPTVDCTACKYCMPCPFGIDIPGIFSHYNKCINEGTFPQNKEQDNYARLRRAYLVSYSRAIPTVRQADHCIGCGECLGKCPQSIQIPSQLHRIDQYIEKLKQGTL
ncbi:MAG: aldo/keto reductase [Candidatus Cryptobacteroides sp.]